MTNKIKISGSLSAIDKADIQTKVSEIKSKLPFLINLTEAERQKLRKMGPKSVAYVQDCLRAAQTFPNVLPPIVKVEEYAKDIVLSNDLSDLLVGIKALCEGLEDTIMAAGSNAMVTSDSIYDYLKNGTKQETNLKAHVEQIGTRFKKTTKKTPPKQSDGA